MIGIQQFNAIVIGSAIAKVYFKIPAEPIMTAAFICGYLALFINYYALVSLGNQEDK